MMLLTQGQKSHLKLHLSQSLSLLIFHNLGVSMQKICCGLPSDLASTLVRSTLHDLLASESCYDRVHHCDHMRV